MTTSVHHTGDSTQPSHAAACTRPVPSAPPVPYERRHAAGEERAAPRTCAQRAASRTAQTTIPAASASDSGAYAAGAPQNIQVRASAAQEEQAMGTS